MNPFKNHPKNQVKFCIFILIYNNQGDYGLVTDGQNEKDNLLNILREIRREHPDAGPDELERMANDRMVRR